MIQSGQGDVPMPRGHAVAGMIVPVLAVLHIQAMMDYLSERGESCGTEPSIFSLLP